MRRDLSTECTRMPSSPISSFLKAHSYDEIAALIAAMIVSRALVSANSTINLPLPADFCCNWTRTSGVLKTSLTTANSGGTAGAALPFPSSVLRTKASVARTERFRSATQRTSGPRHRRRPGASTENPQRAAVRRAPLPLASGPRVECSR